MSRVGGGVVVVRDARPGDAPLLARALLLSARPHRPFALVEERRHPVFERVFGVPGLGLMRRAL